MRLKAKAAVLVTTIHTAGVGYAVQSKDCYTWLVDPSVQCSHEYEGHIPVGRKDQTPVSERQPAHTLP